MEELSLVDMLAFGLMGSRCDFCFSGVLCVVSRSEAVCERKKGFGGVSGAWFYRR